MADETKSATTETQPQPLVINVGRAPTATSETGGGDVTKLREESASYRTQRNAALRRSFAFEQVLKHFDIDTSVITDDALKGLSIKDGKVEGSFEFVAKMPETKTPPPPPSTPPPAKVPGGDATTLTLEDVAKMTTKEINQNWDKVKAVLEAR